MNTQEEKGVQITYLFFYQDEQPRTPAARRLTARPRHQRIAVLRLAVAPKGRAPAPKQRPLALKRRADRRSLAKAVNLTVFLLGRGPGRIHSWELLRTVQCVVGSPVDGWMRSTAECSRKGRLQRI